MDPYIELGTSDVQVVGIRPIYPGDSDISLHTQDTDTELGISNEHPYILELLFSSPV